MKFYTPFITLLAGIALASPASATLLVGYHSFPSGQPDGTLLPNFVASGLSSSIAKNGRPSADNGGSNDQTFGGATFGQLNPGTSDGFFRVFGDGIPILTLTNNRTSSLPLAELLFDAASQNTNSRIIIDYSIENNSFVNIFDSLLPSGALLGNYGDFSVDLSGIVLQSTESIHFRFSNNAGGVRLDNVALTAIPEPANALALALLLSSGVMLRNRRRKA